MKNLKKVLALVLVVAMMMGFSTVASATDFTDDSDISSKEAVEVMSGIGVINGYPDGSFRPEGNVTRAQMAKMIAYIVAGGEDVGDLYAGANSFSDCLTHWARGYIAYANQTGIVAGVGGGLFNPDGTVTGVQAAKMLLCTLGYNQDTEGYTGTGWAVNVLTDARAVGLLDNMSTSNMNGALSRGDAAQMMFNALKADMVEYASGDIVIEGSDSTITVGGSAATKVTTGSNVVGYDGERDGIVQLCEQYFEDLELDTGATDDYERPANTWTYGTDTIGTYAAEADATYTVSTEVGDIYSDLGLNATVAKADIDVYEDGTDGTADYDITRRGSDKYGAQGAEMDVYYDEDAGTVTICIVNTYLAVVTDDDYTSDGDDGVLVDVIDDTGAQDGAYFVKNTSYSQDDVLLVQVANGEVQAVIGEPETVEGTITRISSKDALTVGGTTYSKANAYTAAADGDVIDGQNVAESTEVKIDEDVSYVLYLDQYGNYIAIAVAEDNSESDLVYVADAYAGSATVEGSNRIEYGTIAQIVRLDGTVEDVVIGETQSTVLGDAAEAVSDLVGYFAELSYNNSDDVYELEGISEDAIGDGETYAYRDVPAGEEFAEDDARIVLTSVYYLNDDTVYIFITKDGDKIDTVDVITGGVNYTVPTGNSTAKLAFASGNDAVAFVIEAPYEANNDNIIYFKDGTEYSDRAADGVYTFEGYARGESDKAEFEVASVNGADADTSTSLSGFYKYTENADGYLRLTWVDGTSGDGYSDDFDPEADSFVKDQTLEQIKNGILTFATDETAVVTSAAVVDLTDADKEAENTYGRNIASVSTLQRVLNNDYTVKADLFVNEDNEVVGIYITSILGGNAPDGGEEVTAGGATLKLEGAGTNAVPAIDIVDGDFENGTATITVSTETKGIKVTATEPDKGSYNSVATTLTLNGSDYTSGDEYTVKQSDLNRGNITIVATTTFTPADGEPVVIENTYTIYVEGTFTVS